MRVTCPACGAVSSLDALIGHEAARDCVVAALEQTPVGRRLIRYIALFRPARRQLSWARTASLLTELLDMIRDARIERHGRVWAAPEAVWVAALDEMLARRDAGRLTLPLKSHGYLLEIISGAANRVEASAERSQEAARAGTTPASGHASHRPFAPAEAAPAPDKAAAGRHLARVKAALHKGGEDNADAQ